MGVENQAQLDYLSREGCDESHCYLHSRPLPRADLERLLSIANRAGVNAQKLRLEDVSAPVAVAGLR
jgi:EAL domain-containing protein (putative c-di-GMP-specific phosphodiesterase class I)